jgi:leader peptidase (prepilin peptidase)/N-methyltransferase
MEFVLNYSYLIWVVFAFLFGLMAGSFVSVLAARLPFDKSVVWPGSHCLHCFQPIRWYDNLPILGYLLLRGRCRVCKTPFSARYLWLEVGTGVAFAALFYFEIVRNWHGMDGLKAVGHQIKGSTGLPPVWAWVMFAYQAVFLTLLIAAGVIDAEHRIIPGHVTYTGTVIGILGGIFMPWPWPSSPEAANHLQDQLSWMLPEVNGLIPIGVQLYPFWGPLPDGFAAGTWKLGLANGLIGAAAGMALGRAVKWLFETGMGRDALGLGDADLLMMAGAFLGWQPAALSLFVGACVAVPIIIPLKVLDYLRGRTVEREMSFGPWIAAGIVVTWFAWRWLGAAAQGVFFDEIMLGGLIVVMGGLMLASGLMLRRGGGGPPVKSGT